MSKVGPSSPQPYPGGPPPQYPGGGYPPQQGGAPPGYPPQQGVPPPGYFPQQGGAPGFYPPHYQGYPPAQDQEVMFLGGEAGAPKLLVISRKNITVGALTYHIDGELVPVLIIDMTDQSPAFYFEHHILLWKSPALRIGLKTLKNAFKRFFSGIQIFLTEAKGHGQIAFSRDGAGQIVPIHLSAGQEILVREHQFLAASDNIDFTFERNKGLSNILFGGTGFFIDRFRCTAGEGVLWLHGYGNVFEKVLAPGETLDIEPGGWLYKDVTVKMETYSQNISTGFLASFNLFMNRFTGPGRVGIQSMYLHFPTTQ